MKKREILSVYSPWPKIHCTTWPLPIPRFMISARVLVDQRIQFISSFTLWCWDHDGSPVSQQAGERKQETWSYSSLCVDDVMWRTGLPTRTNWSQTAGWALNDLDLGESPAPRSLWGTCDLLRTNGAFKQRVVTAASATLSYFCSLFWIGGTKDGWGLHPSRPTLSSTEWCCN